MKMDTAKVSTRASSMNKTLDYDKANCLGLNTDYFYMTESDLQTEGLSLKVIRRICFDCPIHGFKYEKYGTFGGYTDQERMLITGKQWNSRELRRMFEQLANLGVRLSTVFEYAAIKPTHIVPAYWKKEGVHE
jgi:hypothetical protein